MTKGPILITLLLVDHSTDFSGYVHEFYGSQSGLFPKGLINRLLKESGAF